MRIGLHGWLGIACNNTEIARPATPLAVVPDELRRKIMTGDLDDVFFCVREENRGMLRVR